MIMISIDSAGDITVKDGIAYFAASVASTKHGVHSQELSS